MKAVLLAALLLPGCGMTYVRPDGSGFGLYPGMVPQKDTIQTIDFTVVAIKIDASRNALTIGYESGRMTNTPVSCLVPVSVPSVKSTKTVSSSFTGGTSITDVLNIGGLE